MIRSAPFAIRMPKRVSPRQSSRLAWLAPALSVLFFAHASVHVTAQLAPDMVPVFGSIDQEAQEGAMGYQWLRWSTETIGHRLTGTTNGARAESTADSLFRVGGIQDVSFFPFTASAWQRRTIQLQASGTADTIVTFTAVALALTPDSAEVSASILDAGNGLRADFDRLGDSLRGRCVLMNIGLIDAPEGTSNLHRSEKAALAIERGACAIIFINNVDGHVLLTGTASVTGQPILIPAACVGSEEGAFLRTWASGDERLRVHLRMTNSNARVSARNVIATIRGSVHPEEVVVVGGHLDSWDLATGATDNGLGSYSILDIARCYSALGLRPERTIKFVLFMGEEEGLLGSSALVDAWEQSGELAHVRCMINLDMSGHPRGFNAFGPSAWRALVDTLNIPLHAMDTSYAAQSNDRPGLHSDHQPFMLQGVPVLAPICDLGGHVYGCYHSSCDDIQLVDPQAMVDNVRRVGALLWLIANAPELPSGFSESDLKARLQAAGLEDKLRIQQLWRWQF